MRYLLFPLLFITLFSCGSEEEEQAVTENSNEEVVVEDTTSEEEAYVPEEPEVRDFDLAEMPVKWVRMETDDAGGFVKYNYWYSQGEGIEFEAEKGDDWYISIYHEQDTETARLSNFSATITEGEGISTVEGEFTYTDGWDKELHSVTFEWDQMWQRVAEFQGLDNGTYFVPEESLHLFDSIDIEREEDEEI